MEKLRQMRNAVLLAALAVGHSVTMAQVVVTYGPVEVASVPTLSEWGMIIMAVVLAGVAVYAMWKNGNSKTIMALFLGAAGLFSAVLGNQTLSEAWAAYGYIMDSPTGGSAGVDPILPLNVGVIEIHNSTQVPLKIISVTPEQVRDASATTCDAGVIVAPGYNCDVDTGPPV